MEMWSNEKKKGNRLLYFSVGIYYLLPITMTDHECEELFRLFVIKFY